MANPTTHPGETSLDRLLGSLKFTLHPTTFVFATTPNEAQIPPLADLQLLFREQEGITAIVSLEYATTHGLNYSFPSRMITVNVTSSLDAVGFMAVIATRLSAHGISTNPVSGFYHDHIFVPIGKEEGALETLEELARDHHA